MPGIEERLGVIIADILAKDRRTTSPDHATIADMGLTSVDMVSLMLGVEREFDLEIPQRDVTAEAFHSVASIAALVRRLASASDQTRPGVPTDDAPRMCAGLRVRSVTSRTASTGDGT